MLLPAVKLALELYCFVPHLLSSTKASVIDLTDLCQKFQSLSFGGSYGIEALLKVSCLGADLSVCLILNCVS